MNVHTTSRRSRADNPIEELASTLQILPPGVRWLHQQPDVIQSLACGMTLHRGPRTALAAQILSFAGFLSLARIVACTGSLFFLLMLILRQRLVARSATLAPCLVVGVGALRECQIVSDLEKERSARVSLINETVPWSFAGYFTVPWKAAWTEWRGVVRSTWPSLADGNATRGGLAADHLRVNFLLRAHIYAYARAWFRELRARQAIVEPVVFTAASVVAYAGCAAGLKTTYHLHGFQRQSLVYPDFDEVVCFTQAEADHFLRRLPNAVVRRKEEPGRMIDTVSAVAIAGAYGQEVGFDSCAAFISWAKARGYAVVVRPHPRDKSGFFDQWRSDEHIIFSDAAGSFDQFLERHRPALLLSWYSTALFDALRRGVVPVTVETEKWRSSDVVFPFEEIALHWPGDQSIAAEFMEKESARRTFLASKRRFAGIADASRDA